MLKIKKFIAIVLIFLLPISTYATVQNQIGFGIGTTGAAGIFLGLATGTAIAMSGGLALGVLGAAIYFSGSNETPTSENAVLTVSLSPNNSKMRTPAGWINPTTPPSSTSVKTDNFWSIVAGDRFETSSLACASQSKPAVYTYSHSEGSPTATCFYSYSGQIYAFGSANLNSNVSCPAGYTISGSTCNLSDASSVIKPVQNIQEIKRVANTFVADTQSNPADIAPANKVAISSNTVTVNGSDGSTSKTTINADGTVTVTNTSPISGTGNSKQVTATFSTPDNSGNVSLSGKTESMLAGQGSSLGTSAPTDPLDISSLNKETTQAGISDKLSQIKDLFSSSSSNMPSDTTAADSQKILDAQNLVTDAITEIGTEQESLENDIFSAIGLPNFIPSFATGTCTPFTGTIHGFNASLDPCKGVTILNEMLGWLFNLFGAWTIFNIFFKTEND